jgi:hypothetical protein
MINLPFSSDVVGAKFVLKQFPNKLKVKEKKRHRKCSHSTF